MSWLERFKPHKGTVRNIGQQWLPDPSYETATGRRLYTVQQMRAAYSQGSKDALGLLARARNLLSHPPHWCADPANKESRYALSVEIDQFMHGIGVKGEA